MANQTEDRIRNNLVSNLSILEEGLTFINKEAYLPHSLGTRGFVDILARDAQGQFVLIELKRSNAACREALHEVLKYIEAVKENFRANEDEIRVLVVSTEWDELLVPFSSFVKRIDCNVQGYVLQVDAACNPLSASPVVPLPLNTDRLLSPQHIISYYASIESMEKGVSSYIASMKAKGVEDYVLLKLSAPLGFHEASIRATHLSMIALDKAMGFDQSAITFDDLKENMMELPCMIYFAAQQMSVDWYLQVLSREPEVYAEAKDFLDNASDEEALLYYEELTLFELHPSIYDENRDVGYPAKLIKILEEQSWSITDIVRFGAFAQNKLLSDQVIMNELYGNQGVTRQRYGKDFDSRNLARLGRIKRDVKACLQDNLVWRNHTLQIFDNIVELVQEKAFTGRIWVYNPNNILHSLYMLFERGDGLRYLPMYHVQVNFPGEESLMYFGVVSPTGTKPELQKILEKYYSGKVSQMTLPLLWGGYEVRDTEIMDGIGLEYRTYVVKKIGESIGYFHFSEGRLTPSRRVALFEGIFQFTSENPDFVRAVVSAFRKHHAGGMYVYNGGD